jgi:hypothetical protein
VGTEANKMEESKDTAKFGLLKEPDKTLISHLVGRCQKAGIEHKLDVSEDGTYHLSILIPCGREKREVSIMWPEDATEFSHIEFEKHRFVQGYEAICSYEYGTIEAYIRPLRGFSRDSLFSVLLGVPRHEVRKMNQEESVFQVKGDVGGKEINIAIGAPTGTIEALTQRELEEELTIKISGISMSTNQEASDILQKLSNSLFFEIRNARGIPIMLEAYHHTPLTALALVLAEAHNHVSDVGFPRYQYDLDPMRLYWYATGASQMPLVQFLAFYQVLEFYFPIYSQQEVHRQVKNILKEPAFDPNHDPHIAKVISAVTSGIGKGHGEERGQLLMTIKACVQDDELREIVARIGLEEYYSTEAKKLSKCNANLENKKLDLREQFAERIYDIRCRIVHTKYTQLDEEQILPFSKEEALLRTEIPIIEFIARKSIVAASEKLSLQ